MKRFIKIVLKVVLVVILLFLCLMAKPVDAAEILGHEIDLDLDLDLDLNPFDKEEEEKTTSETITEAIDNEKGGLFESTIAKALGGIAGAVFNIATSDTINLGFKDYDELIFNKGILDIPTDMQPNILPFSSYTWHKIMAWYRIFTYLASIPILIGAIVTSYKFIIAGTSVQKRNEAKDSLMRLGLGGVAIALAPLFVKLLLVINSYMVSALVQMTNGGLDELLGNGIFSQIKTGNAIATALVICLFAYLFIKLNIKFIIREFTLIIFTVFTPLIAGMWIINKNVTGAAIWFGQIFINVFMQFVYAFLFLIYMNFTSSADGWAVSLLWAMMILPLGDVLLNTMQNLVSRIAGLNNEEMANRGIGMGAAMAYSVHAIGSQFKSNNENKGGFINRIKNVTNRNKGTENASAESSVSKSMSNEQRTVNSKSQNKRKIPKVSLYGIGRSFLNTGMFLAEGRNFADKGLTGNRRNYGQNMRKNEIDSNVTQSLNNETEKSDTNDKESY